MQLAITVGGTGVHRCCRHLHFSLHFGSDFLHVQSKELCLVWLVTKHETSLKILSIKKRTSFLTRFFNFLAALLKTFIHFMPHYGICSITQSISFVPQEIIWNFTARTEYFLPVNETLYYGYLEWFFFFHWQVLKGYLIQYFQNKTRKVNYLRKSTSYQSTHLSQFHIQTIYLMLKHLQLGKKCSLGLFKII